MHQSRRLRLAASIMLCFVLQTLGDIVEGNYENRPYEFGFTIDGEQHRQESKDKDGIIMGEYGFITADDVYHVIVYATDKEGRFKILSMKDNDLKSDIVSSHRAPTQPVSVQASAISQKSPKHDRFTIIALLPLPRPTYLPPAVFTPPRRSCSLCSLPSTTTRAPPSVFNQGNENNNYNIAYQFSARGPSPRQQTSPLANYDKLSSLMII